MKQRFILVAAVACTALLSSCEYQRYNKATQLDVRKDSKWVYGVHPDSAAKQLSNKYTDNPELEKRVTDLHKKLYGNDAVTLK